MIVVEHLTKSHGLVKWATWQEYKVIQYQFPQFPHEDKVKLVGAGIDGSIPI